MQQPSVVHHTFTLERSYAASPERVFAAMSEAARKRRWQAEGPHHEVELFEMDFRVGGAERAHLRFGDAKPFPGALLTREAFYLDIVPEKRVVIASVMTLAGRRISASLETFDLLAAGTGTELLFTHQAAFFEGADGPAMRQDGWVRLLGSLEEEVGG